jgi:hypothetical protein
MMVQLKRQFGIDESNIVALVASNLVPIVATILIILFIYWLALREVHSKSQIVTVPITGESGPKAKVARQRQSSKSAIEKKIESQVQVWREARNFAFLSTIVVGLLVAGWSMVAAIDSGSALMTVTSTTPTTDPAPGTFGINVFTSNTGTASAIAVRHSYIFLSGPAEAVPTVLEQASNGILEQLKNSRSLPITTETQKNEQTYYTDVGLSKDFDDNKKGVKSLYLLNHMEYKDKYLPSSKYRVTESCWIIAANGSMVRCDAYNRVFERD